MNAPQRPEPLAALEVPAVMAHALRHLAHGLAVLDPAHRVSWCNEAFSTLTGRAVDEILGQAVEELLGWDAAAGGVAAVLLREALAQTASSRRVMSLCRLDGHRFWAAVELQWLGDKATPDAAWCLTLVDLSGRQLSVGQLRQVVAGAAVPMILRDAGGVAIEVNVPAQALFGLPVERIVGGGLQDLPWRVIDGEGMELPADWLPEVVTLQTGQAIQDFSMGVLLPDGRRRWLNVSTWLVAREIEQDAWVATHFQDVTERREMQADLDRQWRRLLSSLEGSRTSTWEWNLQTGETQFDDRAAEMIGQPPEAMWPPEMATWAHHIHPDDLPATQWLLDQHTNGQTDYFEQELRMRHADGSWRWIRDRGRLGSRTPDGKPEWVYGTREDITERKQAELAAARDHALLQGLFDLAPIGIELIDLTMSRPLLVNGTLAHILGHEPGTLLDPDATEQVCPAWRAGRATWFDEVILNDRFGPAELSVTRPDGSTATLVTHGVRINVASRDHLWLTVQDVTAARAMELELRIAANQDRLTGLANRASLLRELQALNQRALGEAGQGYSLFFLDFDRFKLVNDTLGHDAGDELLRGIAERLRKACAAKPAPTPEDRWLPARLGGDEFVVLAPRVGGRQQAQREAEGLLMALAEPYAIKQQQIHSSASIGIAVWRAGQTDPDELLRDADIAMYEAKRQGRRRAVLFDDGMHQRISRAVHIENALRDAVARGEMFVAYQPIVDLETGRMTSAEALLRWRHPDLGLISPGEFIPIAEESGHILAIGEWVLREACAQWKRWSDDAPEEAPLTVSVNLSRVQLTLGERLLAAVQDALSTARMPPSALQLEITEREVMRDKTGTRDLMQGLRALGVKLAMDDFGTGASSLGCLREFPFHTIKIDKSFVTGLCQDPQVMAVAHATVSVIENLGMASVAEGIEDASEAAALQGMGCRFGQGFLFARPLPPDQLLTALKRAAD